MSKLAEWLVGIAAVGLPRGNRARYAEQWAADLRDAEQVGVGRFQIVVGAFGVTAGTVRREIWGRELRATLSWVQPAIFLLLLAIPLYFAVVRDDVLHLFGGPGVALRGSFGVFSYLMGGGPLIYLLFPLYVVFISCLRLYREVPTSERVTVRRESYLFARLATAGGISFVAFAFSTFLLFVLAFYVWPALGNPSVDPGVYFLTPETAVTSSFTESTYSQLLALGPLTFGILYSFWVGFCAAIWTSLAMAALLTVRNRPLAVALPFLVYIAQWVAASLLGNVRASFAASTFPFGYQQTSILAGAAPMLVLTAIAAAIWAKLLRPAHRPDVLFPSENNAATPAT
ncbi:hypothetical protein [Frigoribacterium sp. UYMn621]|uniref:hypothetical protein n=1 Tax=Frigoribacterium sp. UYMn621 TaxID=3156343 RepID=UPI003391FA13